MFPELRVGHGFDVHAFGPGQEIVLGGVHIPHVQGLVAHSDGDVLVHALCDALLGAAALGDIGQHFPDTEARWRGVDSRVLLREVMQRIRAEGWVPMNLDALIIAQAPRMQPHLPAMRLHLAADCGLSSQAVNIKATTTERLGFTGRQEGIAAEAVTLLVRAHTVAG
jgi:2-C-methyl-D-erythritol 2,4-cyclodiphosphate synthase